MNFRVVSPPSDSDNTFIVTDGSDTEPQQMILGPTRNNPYDVAVMTQAWNNLYEVQYDKLPVTDLYIKFEPASYEDMNVLFDSDLILYDHPLENEILQDGDYYQEEMITGTIVPYLYSVVKPDTDLPNVPYTVVSELVIPPYETILTAEAFRLAEVEYTYVDDTDVSERKPLNPPPGWFCAPGCPSYPCCLAPQIYGFIECDEIVSPCDMGWPDEDCLPGNGNWPDCMHLDPPPSGPIIRCGCTLPGAPGIPSGCVRVEDTQLSDAEDFETWEGVQYVKVEVRVGWFGSHSTMTDQNGCWALSKSFSPGQKVRLRIEFKNSRAKFRAKKGLGAIKHNVGEIQYPYSHTAVGYSHVLGGGNGHIRWGASTANNALHQFHTMAAADGILTPPDRMNIYIRRKKSGGYALMRRFLGASAAYSAILNGGLVAVGTEPFLNDEFYNGLFTSIIGYAFFSAWAPDVGIGIDYEASDQLKRLCFHEYAHASHFLIAGDNFWKDVITAEVSAGGHGSQNTSEPHGGIIEVAESWAEFIGRTYAHRMYGGQSSVPEIFDNPIAVAGWNWRFLLERTWNESQNHIPIGLHHDLLDAGEATTSWNADNCCAAGAGTTGIVDNVRGITIAQMFATLTGSTRNIGQYQNAIINSATNVNATQQDIINLFNTY